jgi:hypothetical protein
LNYTLWITFFFLKCSYIIVKVIIKRLYICWDNINILFLIIKNIIICFLNIPHIVNAIIINFSNFFCVLWNHTGYINFWCFYLSRRIQRFRIFIIIWLFILKYHWRGLRLLKHLLFLKFYLILYLDLYILNRKSLILSVNIILIIIILILDSKLIIITFIIWIFLTWFSRCLLLHLYILLIGIIIFQKFLITVN